MKKQLKDLIKHMERLIPENGFYHILDEEKLFAETIFVHVQPHADDEALSATSKLAMLNKLAEEEASATLHRLAREDVGIVIVNLTDGSARGIKGVSPEELTQKRRQESIVAAETLGAAMVVNLGYPDAQLQQYEEDAIDLSRQVLKELKPDAVIAPHGLDPHPDHASANRIAKRALDGTLPFYSMDTITMLDKNGDPLNYTHAFRMSEEENRLRGAVYLAHKSQTSNLPPHEMKDVESVLSLPARRAKQLNKEGVVFASILVQELNGKLGDPVGELLKGDRII